MRTVIVHTCFENMWTLNKCALFNINHGCLYSTMQMGRERVWLMAVGTSL